MSGPSATRAVAARHLRLPSAPKRAAVGLFGGSFNPPHQGHALVTEIALRRLKLQRLWWIVTPGNPLKDRRQLAPLADRLDASERLAGDPRIAVTAFEAAFDLRYTADTLALLRARNVGVRFVWIMGADNLRDFHHWHRWRDIVENVPIAVIDRPGSTLSYLSSKMAIAYGRARIDEDDAALLARCKPPCWTFIRGPRSSLSSTALRAAAGQG